MIQIENKFRIYDEHRQISATAVDHLAGHTSLIGHPTASVAQTIAYE